MRALGETAQHVLLLGRVIAFVAAALSFGLMA
jgi:hypothetical protein